MPLQQARSLVKSIDLIWIVVDDFQAALKFYTEVVGLTLLTNHGDFWAELAGPNGGALLGISQKNEHCPIPPGHNAVLTLTVDDLDAAIEDLRKKGAKLVGDKQEVPGHARLQLFVDPSGNHGQLVQTLEPEPKHHHSGGCCKHH